MMKPIMELIEELKQVGNNPAAAVREAIEKTGRQAVGCFPIYAPEELVYAAGALPIGMWGGQARGSRADKYFQSFCCSLMKANTEQSLRGDYDCLSAVIATTYCDTQKCVVENWKAAVPHLNVIPMVYPQNRKSVWAREFLKEEFERVRRALERVLSVRITDAQIQSAVEIYEAYRETMRRFVDAIAAYPELFNGVTRHQIIKAAYFMDKKLYTRRIRSLLNMLGEQPKGVGNKKRIILTGLLAEPTELLEIFDENGFLIVADDLAQESRQFRTIVPGQSKGIDRMVERIVLQDGCAFLYDEQKRRGENLIRMVRQYQADAVVFCQLKFCDPDEFDYPIIDKRMKEAGVPMLYLEFEQQMESVGQLRSRIQSFSEVLENKKGALCT